MNVFQEATKCKLRFKTPKGELNVEQLYSLPIVTISSLIVELNSIIKPELSENLSFLNKTTSPIEKDYNQLRFDVLKEIYIDLTNDINIEQTKAANKLHNQKIAEIIAAKESNDLAELSIDELKALYR